MPIYKDQTAARLILQTGINFNNYAISVCEIYYQKPSGVEGKWTAAKLPNGEIPGKIYVDFSNVIKFDEVGRWKLWSYITFPDTRTAQGDPAYYNVISKQVVL